MKTFKEHSDDTPFKDTLSTALRQVYDKGFYHGETGYGFQKSVAGRKGTAQYDAYQRGYYDGTDDPECYRNPLDRPGGKR